LVEIDGSLDEIGESRGKIDRRIFIQIPMNNGWERIGGRLGGHGTITGLSYHSGFIWI
jgi:hypothetical protein